MLDASGKKTVDIVGKKTDKQGMHQVSHLLAVADEFIRVTGTKEVTLSFWVFNDSKKLASLRTGSDITVGRFNAALVWFAGRWPDGANWPREISRPTAQETAA